MKVLGFLEDDVWATMLYGFLLGSVVLWYFRLCVANLAWLSARHD